MQNANFYGKPLLQATKQHLKKFKSEKWDVGCLPAFGWAVLGGVVI